MPPVSLARHYEAYDRLQSRRTRTEQERRVPRSLVERYLGRGSDTECNGFTRMAKCREALEALDRTGWQRSFHQRMFHDHFLRACSRVFWKTDPPGAFARDHERILAGNGWDHLHQEVLVSTPRRWVERE